MKFTKAEALQVWAKLPESVKQRVRAGVELLDKKRRAPWRNKVNTAKLRMSAGQRDARQGHCGCVLAQVYGEYFDGATKLGLGAWSGVGNAQDYGFSAGSPTGYKKLDKAWSALLTMEQ